MKIRRLDRDERPTASFPTQTYSFQPSPVTNETLERWRRDDAYYAENLTLVAEDGGNAVAEVAAIAMRQNVRGSVYPMAGIAGVAAQPHVRRRGYVRALLIELLGQMRESGHAVSALHPFRPSFYQRFGYVGVPKTRTVRFPVSELEFLLRTPLDGEVAWHRVSAGFEDYRGLTHRLLSRRHGFAVFPGHREERLRDVDERWLVTARVSGEVTGAVTYRITGFGERLVADDLLVTSPLSRALILQFFARHIDQVTDIVMTVPSDELPELWATDLTTVVETRTSYPTEPAPMARVLSLDALNGMAVGPGRVAVEIVDDHFLQGRYILDGMAGALDISAGRDVTPTVTLTAAGLSGLVYGVLDPGDVVVRGLGDVPPDQAADLAKLFPRTIPYFYSRF
jgi:predicted N-acetyltransferase YhbS